MHMAPRPTHSMSVAPTKPNLAAAAAAAAARTANCRRFEPSRRTIHRTQACITGPSQSARQDNQLSNSRLSQHKYLRHLRLSVGCNANNALSRRRNRSRCPPSVLMRTVHTYLREVPDLASLDPLEVVLRADEAVNCLRKEEEEEEREGLGTMMMMMMVTRKSQSRRKTPIAGGVAKPRRKQPWR